MKNPYSSRDPKEWKELLTLIQQAVSEEKLDLLLSMLLTVDERNTLGLRVQIIRELLANRMPQREIQQHLNTSAATITRGSNMLKSIEPQALQWINEKLSH